jgi:hypothetical protein
MRGVSYHAFVDPSGGSADSMTLCIGHKDSVTRTIIVDALREVKPPFSPEAVVVEFVQVLKSYSVAKVTGDKYAGEWPREVFSKYNIIYDASAKPKSELYIDLLALLNSQRIWLLDHPKLVNQLCALERRTTRGSGRDVIDHPPGGHDDLSNVVAGISQLINKPAYDFQYRGWNDDPSGDSGSNTNSRDPAVFGQVYF